MPTTVYTIKSVSNYNNIKHDARYMAYTYIPIDCHDNIIQRLPIWKDRYQKKEKI